MPKDEQKDSQNPNPQGESDEGGEKLFAGKFRTQEDLEKAYKELETAFHDRPSRREFDDLKQTIESRLPDPSFGGYQAGPAGYVPYGQSGQYQGPNPQDEQTKNTQLLAEFYRDPAGTLRRVKEEAVQEVSQRQMAMQGVVQIYEQWRGENADISDETALIDYYVRQEQPQMHPRQKLERAAPKVREHLARIKRQAQANASPTPNPSDHVETPGGSRAQASPTVSASKPTAESELATYISERKRAMGPKKPAAGA